jgi:hypothetical protein
MPRTRRRYQAEKPIKGYCGLGEDAYGAAESICPLCKIRMEK